MQAHHTTENVSVQTRLKGKEVDLIASTVLHTHNKVCAQFRHGNKDVGSS